MQGGRWWICGLLGAVAWAQTPAQRAVFASDFGRWTIASLSGIAVAGTVTVTADTGTVTAAGGEVMPAVTAGTPLLIDSGEREEKVTPAGGCAAGSGSCSFTVTVSQPHPGHFAIASGSHGLQEAINFEHQSGGGVVALDRSWQGSDTDLADAQGYSNVMIHDERVPLRWLRWGGSSYEEIGNLSSAGLPHAPAGMQYGGLTDFGAFALRGVADSNLAGGGFHSALRLSLFANAGGTYGLTQPDYPILNGEAVGRTQGQVGGLFTFNRGYGFSNVQGLNGIAQCWGGAEPVAGGSVVQCSAMGEQDVEAADTAAVVRLNSPPATGATQLSYTPVAHESSAGARQWFDISRRKSPARRVLRAAASPACRATTGR